MNLRFNFHAIERLYSERDIDLMELALRGKSPTPSEITALVWAGQLHQRPDLTLEQARDQIAAAKYLELVRSVTKAITDALAVPDEEEDNEG